MFHNVGTGDDVWTKDGPRQVRRETEAPQKQEKRYL